MEPMVFRAFSYSKDSEAVNKWGEKYGFPLPPELMLPNIGFIVEGLACGFLYTTNSKLGFIEWVFSNPDSPKEQRSEALDLIFALLQNTAQNLDIHAVLSASAFPAYSSILERNGFKEKDKNMTHFLKVFGGN